MRVQFGFLVPPPSLVTSPSGSTRAGGLRLGAEDFAAPADVGSSYLFERLLGWGVALGVRLRAEGVRLELGAPPPDDEGRHLFFVRARPKTMAGPSLGSRTEIHKARPAGVAYLGFRLGVDAAEVAFIVPAKARAERAHLERLLAEKPRLVADALDALPLNFVLGDAADSAARKPVQDVDRGELDALLRSGESLWIGWTVPRSAALTHAATVGGELEAAMLALGELFRQLAWLQRAAPSAASAATKTRHREERGRSAKNELAVDDGASRDVRTAPLTADDRLALLRGARAAARPDARAQLRLRSSAGGRTARATAHGAGSAKGSAGATASAGVRSRSRPPSAPGAGAHPDSVPGVDRGAEVEVLAGPFTGRVGVVQEVDGKGDARVLFGLLATRIAAKNLALAVGDAAGKARPSLGSSHRKGR